MNTGIKTRNNSVDFFRLLCACLIVGIHSCPFAEFGTVPSFLMRQVFAQLAVPFFFAIAGYYYIKALTEGKAVFLSYVRRLLVLYTLWSVVYLGINFVGTVVLGSNTIGMFLKESVRKYFVTGAYFHLWYFPVLFCTIFITTLLNKCKALPALAVASLVLYLLGCGVRAAYLIAKTVPALSTIVNWEYFETVMRVFAVGIPFFLMGYYVNRFLQRPGTMSNKLLGILIAVCAVVFVAEAFLMRALKLENGITLYPLLFFILIWLLRHPMEKFSKLGSYARFAANFTYFGHLLAPMLRYLISKNLFLLSFSHTEWYLIMVAFGITGGVVIRLINNKWLNKLVI